MDHKTLREDIKPLTTIFASCLSSLFVFKGLVFLAMIFLNLFVLASSPGKLLLFADLLFVAVFIGPIILVLVAILTLALTFSLGYNKSRTIYPLFGYAAAVAFRPQRFRYLVSENYKIIYWINKSRKRIEIVHVFDCRRNPKAMKKMK